MQGYGTGDGPSPHHQHHHFLPKPTASGQGRTDKGDSDPILYYNCTIVTADDLRNNFSSASLASAFVIKGGRFDFVGSLEAVKDQVGAIPAESVDLQGDYITPGFIDAHLHLINGGFSISRLNLNSVTSREEFVELVSNETRKVRGLKNRWIVGSNWDEGNWGGELPTWQWIDVVTQHNPTILVRSDGHVALVNQLALTAANVTEMTPDPEGGTIFRFPGSNVPNGLLADAAISLVVRTIPKPTVEERMEAVRSAQRHALAHGITAVHDMGRIAFQDGDEAAMDDLEKVYMKMADEDSLKLRVYAFVPLSQWRRLAERVRYIGKAHPKGRLTWGGVKEFYDGSLGGRTALMHKPYSDGGPDQVGLKTVNDTIFREQLQAAHHSQLQIAVHAIGDRAVDEVLNAYIELIGEGNNTLGHRIEHVQHIAGKETAQRLASYGIIATTNPVHYLSDRGILDSRLGADRAQWSFAFKTMSTSKVSNLFASDWPVAPIDPLVALNVATLKERKESVQVDEAFVSYTAAHSTFAGHLGNDVGVIRAGMLADFVRLNASPFAKEAKVVETYVNGVCEFGCLKPRNGFKKMRRNSSYKEL